MPLTSLDLGPVYCGLRKLARAHVVNTGPTAVNFSMSKMVNADAAPVEGEDAAGPIFVTPLMGALAAGASMEISAIFAPPKAPRPAKGYVATVSEAEADEKFGREAHAAQYGIEVLETGQKVTLGLRGRLVERRALVVPPPAAPPPWDARLGLGGSEGSRDTPQPLRPQWQRGAVWGSMGQRGAAWGSMGMPPSCYPSCCPSVPL